MKYNAANFTNPKFAWTLALRNCPDATYDAVGNLLIPDDSECLKSVRKQNAKTFVRVAVYVGSGPGTELKTILHELGIDPIDTCDCEKRARQMDQWGVEGCRPHRAEIIQWLREGDRKLCWKHRTAAKLKAAFRSIPARLVLKINPLDPFGSIVDEAIRRASDK